MPESKFDSFRVRGMPCAFGFYGRPRLYSRAIAIAAIADTAIALLRS
ncbi:hypothetical protein LG3211_4659 [Lysobacter gummosus]|nr:hypothetical protein LG3211_4659 [Lysobacter gummosus]